MVSFTVDYSAYEKPKIQKFVLDSPVRGEYILKLCNMRGEQSVPDWIIFKN